ncbi:MAG: VCBS repeat-containing protein, partial [Ignavibacteriaceae bacterium]
MENLTKEFDSKYKSGRFICRMLCFYLTVWFCPVLSQGLDWQTSLWPTNDTLYIGNYNHVKFGQSVAVGDVNGDGYDDVIVCSEEYVHVYGGPLSKQNGWDWDQPIVEIGKSSYHSFKDVCVADVNGDGIMDIIIGQNQISPPNLGWIYEFFGRSSWTKGSNPLQLDFENDADLKIGGPADTGTQGGYFGRCVAPAGDRTGDGYDDIIVGAYNDKYADV